MKLIIVAFISLTLLGACAHYGKTECGCHKEKATCSEGCSADKKMKSGACKDCDDGGACK